MKNCIECQKCKINRHTKSSVQEFVLPSSARFQFVHIDIVGPLPPAQDGSRDGPTYRYLLTMIDRATRWIEAVPLSEITALAVAQAFVNCWISRFSCPLYTVCPKKNRHFSPQVGIFEIVSWKWAFYSKIYLPTFLEIDVKVVSQNLKKLWSFFRATMEVPAHQGGTLCFCPWGLIYRTCLLYTSPSPRDA